MGRRYVAVSASIIVMWTAVLFISLFAPELHSYTAGGNTTTLPIAGIVAATFAFIATIVVASVGFGRSRDQDAELEQERLERERLELRVRELVELAAAPPPDGAPTQGKARLLLHR